METRTIPEGIMFECIKALCQDINLFRIPKTFTPLPEQRWAPQLAKYTLVIMNSDIMQWCLLRCYFNVPAIHIGYIDSQDKDTFLWSQQYHRNKSTVQSQDRCTFRWFNTCFNASRISQNNSHYNSIFLNTFTRCSGFLVSSNAEHFPDFSPQLCRSCAKCSNILES